MLQAVRSVGLEVASAGSAGSASFLRTSFADHLARHPFLPVPKMRLSVALSGALSLATLALASSDVVDLTAKSFDKEVTNDSGLTLVEFFAPWWCVRPGP